MKISILKNSVITTLLLNLCCIFICIFQIINNKLDLPISLIGFPMGYINIKVISNKSIDKKSKIFIIISCFCVFIMFMYACFIKN